MTSNGVKNEKNQNHEEKCLYFQFDVAYGNNCPSTVYI